MTIEDPITLTKTSFFFLEGNFLKPTGALVQTEFLKKSEKFVNSIIERIGYNFEHTLLRTDSMDCARRAIWVKAQFPSAEFIRVTQVEIPILLTRTMGPTDWKSPGRY